MFKKYLISITVITLFLAPLSALALTMPQTAGELAGMSGVKAAAYLVTDVKSGQVLISQNADLPLIPASLTKVITILVVLDTKPKLTKIVTMNQADQVAGMCKQGGVCIKSKAGVKFTVDGLLHAALILSANNATNALARSTGLSPAAFAKKMNAKATSLGATSSYFVEPTGLDPSNVITASDYSKILIAAFSNPYLSKITGLNQYSLRSSNNAAYTQTLKNANKLLADGDIEILGAKTGYLNESRYNFASVLKYRTGQELAIVVLGEDHLYTAFEETKTLAGMAWIAGILGGQAPPSSGVLGTSTVVSINN